MPSSSCTSKDVDHFGRIKGKAIRKQIIQNNELNKSTQMIVKTGHHFKIFRSLALKVWLMVLSISIGVYMCK